MSQERLGVVRGVIEAWNQRDVDAALRYLAPDVEWAPAGPAAVERVVYRGTEECARGFTAVWETWDVFRFEESEVRDRGDSALWLGHVHMRGRTSHVELDQEFGIHFVLRDDKIVQARAFPSWRAALEAAGPSE